MMEPTRLFLFCLCFFAVAASPLSAAPPPWEVEDLIDNPAPEFSLAQMDDSPLSLSSLKGKAVLINFWATWCGPCLAEMPSLNELYQKLKQDGLVVVAVSIDEQKSSIVNFLGRLALDFSVVHDQSQDTAQAYKVFAYPSSFLIDRQGVLRKKYIGEQNWMDRELYQEISEFVQK